MISRRELIIGAAAVGAVGVAIRSPRQVSADPFCQIPAPRWSDPATWGGTVPAPGANVTLPQVTVVLDVDASVGELFIPAGASLLFDPTASRTLSASGNVIVNGALRAHPNSADVVSTMRFVNVNEAAFVGGGMEPLPSDVGLWVVGAGVIDMVGTPKTSWVRAASIVAGDQVVALAEPPIGWQVGDTIAIAPSGANLSTSYDTRTIAAVSANLVTLSSPCAFAHPYVELEPGFGYGAEVLNLTRNVIVEGSSTGRAHLFISTSVAQAMSHVELRHLGPRQASGSYTAGVVGRYPLHVHMAGDGSRGSTFTGLVAHTCGNGAFVPHLSHGCAFTGCIAHDTFDKAFWWDEGDPSNDTTWQSCVASNVRSDPTFRGYGLNGFTLGDGAGNRVLDCSVVGVQGNSSAAGVVWPEGTFDVWQVERTLAHNCRRNGFRVWQNTGPVHVVSDFVCANNGAAGIEHGAYRNSYKYANGWLVGNALPVSLHALSADAATLTTFERVLMSGGVNAVALARHNLPGEPVQFLGCEFVGQSGATIASAGSSMVNPDMADVIEGGPVSVTWNANSHPSSVIRVQHAGTATQHTPTGSASIAPFSTYTPVARVPFPVLASA